MTKQKWFADFSTLRLRLAPLYKRLPVRGTTEFAIAAVFCTALLTIGAVQVRTRGLSRMWKWVGEAYAAKLANGGRDVQNTNRTAQPHPNSGSFANFNTCAFSGAIEGSVGASINVGGTVAGDCIGPGNVLYGFVVTPPYGAGDVTVFSAPHAGTASGEGTYPLGIDANGDVTGISVDSSHVSHGFVAVSPYGTANITIFNVSGAGTDLDRGTKPLGISNGIVTGTYEDDNQVYHGFTYDVASRASTAIDDPNAACAGNSTEGTIAKSINTAGTVTGFYADENCAFQGFIYNGNFAPLSVSEASGTIPAAINAAGAIAGAYTDSKGLYHGFVAVSPYGAANITTLTAPGATTKPGSGEGPGSIEGTLASSINSAGEVAGFYIDPEGVVHCFTWANGQFTSPIDDSGAGTGGALEGTACFGINDSGLLTGGYADTSEEFHGFVYTPSVAPGFTVSPKPSSLTIAEGSDGTSTITVAPEDEFTGSVTLSASGLPSGVTAGFSPNPVSITGTSSATSTLTLAASKTATTGKATVTVTGTSGSLMPDTELTLSVTPAGLPVVTLSPTSLKFANEVINTTSTAKLVTLKNTGTATLDISNIDITPSTNFKISSNTCGSTLVAGKSCKVGVEFEPTTLGALRASLVFTDNASNSPQSVPLSGTGVEPATLTPSKASFGKQKVGTASAAKKFTLTNNQTVELTSVAVSVAGSDSNDFSYTTCGSTLAPKGKCTISVTFKPTETGARTAELKVTDSAGNSPQIAALNGTGD